MGGNCDLIRRQKGNLRRGSLLPTQNRASSPASVIDRLADSMPLSLFTENTVRKTRTASHPHFINEEIVVENQVTQLRGCSKPNSCLSPACTASMTPLSHTEPSPLSKFPQFPQVQVQAALSGLCLCMAYTSVLTGQVPSHFPPKTSWPLIYPVKLDIVLNQHIAIWSPEKEFGPDTP